MFGLFQKEGEEHTEARRPSSKYEPSSQTWKTAGKMKKFRYVHAVAVIDKSAVMDYCSDYLNKLK